MDLYEFIDTCRWPKNAWVDHPEFSGLYVRKGRRILMRNAGIVDTLDLANLTAAHPGSGAFRRLVTDLRKRYPGIILYCESVLNERFDEYLQRNAWVRSTQTTHPPYSYWLPPVKGPHAANPDTQTHTLCELPSPVPNP